MEPAMPLWPQAQAQKVQAKAAPHKAQCNLVNIDMLLNEFIYFSPEQEEMSDKGRYDPLDDKTSVLHDKDTRKTRLTLRIINDLRRASEARDRETKENLIVVRQMYAMPTEEEGAAPAM